MTKIGGVNYVIVFAWDVTYVTHMHNVSVYHKTFSHYYIVVYSMAFKRLVSFMTVTQSEAMAIL